MHRVDLVVVAASVLFSSACVGGDDNANKPDSSTDATQNDVAATDTSTTDGSQDTSTQDAGWTPTSLVGLSFWYSATNAILNTGNVVGWTDLSPNHNDATLSHGTVVVHTNAVKGAHDALTFSTAAMSVPDSSSLQWGAASDYVVAFVGSYTSPGNAGAYFIHKLGPYANSNAIGWMAYAGGDGQLWSALSYNGPFVKAGTGVNDGVFRIYVSRRKNGGATLETRVNGVPVTATVAAQNVNTTNPMIIGSYDANASQQSLVGDIAEVIGARGTIADADVAAIEAFLKAKYGL